MCGMDCMDCVSCQYLKQSQDATHVDNIYRFKQIMSSTLLYP